MFNKVLYDKLLSWAGDLVRTKIDNLTEYDLINQAYVNIYDANENFTEVAAKKYAKKIFFSELHHYNERRWEDPWVDSFAVCTKCGEAQPVAAFGTDKAKYVDGYCKECVAKINRKQRLKAEKKTAVKSTCRITVFNHYGEVVVTAKSMIELGFKFRKCSKKTVEVILYKGYRHKTIHPYSEDVKFLEKRFNNKEMNYYIKKEAK